MRYSEALKAGMKFSVFITNPTDERYPQGWHYFEDVEDAQSCSRTEAYADQQVVYTIKGSPLRG